MKEGKIGEANLNLEVNEQKKKVLELMAGNGRLDAALENKDNDFRSVLMKIFILFSELRILQYIYLIVG